MLSFLVLVIWFCFVFVIVSNSLMDNFVEHRVFSLLKSFEGLMKSKMKV